MEKHDNLKCLIENSNFDKSVKIDDRLINLSTYSGLNERNKKNLRMFPVNLFTRISMKNGECVFNYKGKKYPFSLLSDRKLQTIDERFLKNYELRERKSLVRTLKLACSMDLVNPKVIIGNSPFTILDAIISFEEDGVKKIIDYSQNLVMKADDYFELFKFEELNILSKNDLYSIYLILKESNDYSLIYYFLLFSKEMLDDISRKGLFYEVNVNKKFYNNGINRNNDAVMGRLCDQLFSSIQDMEGLKYAEARNEIDTFTLNPSQESEHIKYNPSKEKYIFKDDEFGCFEFGLLSDMIEYEPLKNELLSESRYHRCHPNVHRVVNILGENDFQEAYIVAGKAKSTETDYFYHSWVESDNKNVVIDYNHNLIMNRDKYYKLYGAVAITKTKAQKMDEVSDFLTNKAELEFLCSTINYFGEDIYNDMMKNEKIFRK